MSAGGSDGAGSRFAEMPAESYFAVIFTNQRTSGENGYDATAARMVELAAQQPGYLGIESTRDESGFGITVSYWESLEAIAAWRSEAEHLLAQQRGRSTWYARYELRVARVERARTFNAASRESARDPRP